MAGLVAVLAAIGVAAGLERAVLATASLDRSAEGLARSAAADSALYGILISANLAVPAPGTPRRAELAADFARMQAKFAAHPWVTLLHVVPGTLFMLLAPLQLVARIRNRWRAFHRWSGRLLLVMGVPVGLSALYFAWFARHAAAGEAPVITLFVAVFLLSGARAWRAIRRGDVASHREWMIRFLAGGLAISTVRLVAGPFSLLTSVDLRTAAVLAMSAGWLITLGVAEWWIRRRAVVAA